MKTLIKEGAKLGIVTKGAEGSYYMTANFEGFVPVFNVDTVDSTGCGDSFVSGVLSAIAEKDFNKIIDSKDEMISIIKFATAAASLTSMKKGVIPALPYRNEVEEFLMKYKK